MTALYRFDIEQGTPDWLLARSGIITGSKFGILVTPTGKPSTSEAVRTYMGKLIAERIDPKAEIIFAGKDAERGNQLEPQARAWYEFATDNEVTEVGIVYRDDDMEIAASPDGLVGEDGGIEIKCLNLANHIKALIENAVPKEHIMQCHANMWVTGRQWWDFICYHPQCRTLSLRIERDEKMMAVFEDVVPAFAEKVNQMEKWVRDNG